jgi:hypothetical protein
MSFPRQQEHPFYKLTERGIDVTVAGRDGGKVEFDGYSDPRDPSHGCSEDLISMGFIHAPVLGGPEDAR